MLGKVFLDHIFALVNAVVVLGAVGLVFYSHKMMKRPPTDQEQEWSDMKKAALGELQIAPFKMKKLTINLQTRKTRLRYLDIEVDLLPFEGHQTSVLAQHESLLADTVIGIAGAMTPEELNSLSGKILLEERIKSRINQALKGPVVKDVFFSTFVIQ